MDTVEFSDIASFEALEIVPGRLFYIDTATDNVKRKLTFPILFKIGVVVICRKGKARGAVDDIPVMLKEGDVLFIMPGSNLLEFEILEDGSEIPAVMVADAEQFRSTVIDRKLWGLFVKLRYHPVIHLEEDDVRLFETYANLMTELLSLHQDAPFKEQAVASCTNALFYTMLNMLHRRIPHEEIVDGTNIASRLFLSFVELCEKSEGRLRSVGEAADTLCVSPKYLSRVVKKNSGMTPSQWLDEFVMRAVLYYLMHTDRSVKDIAATLGFPNPSTFGSFVRRQVGMTPSEYRATRRYVNNR